MRSMWCRATHTTTRRAVVAKETPKKRKGPLPLWFAEVLLIGLYAGIVLAATKYYKQSSAALGSATSLVTGVYQKVEGLLPSKK